MVVYTAGFMTYVTCRLTAKNRDQLRNSTLGSRVLATFVKGPHCSHAVRKCGPFLHVLCSAICVSVYWANGWTNRDTVCGDIFVDPRNVVLDGSRSLIEKDTWGGGNSSGIESEMGCKIGGNYYKGGVCIGDAVFSESNFYLLKTHHI